MLQLSFFSLFLFLVCFFFAICLVDSFPNQVGNRTFNLINNCSLPVWLDIRGGPVKNTPRNGNYRIDPKAINYMDFPVDNSTDRVFSGNVAICFKGACDNSEEACDAKGCGPIGPISLAEFTISYKGTDVYDLSVINGLNVPMSVVPVLTEEQRKEQAAKHPGDDYWCGGPGSPQPPTPAGPSSWDLVPPSYHYKFVVAGGVKCSNDADCSNGEVCGSSDNPGTPRVTQTCGQQLGFWTAGQVCGTNNTYGYPFNCSEPLPYAPGHTLNDLYGCYGGSCYGSNPSDTCCGCANWDKELPKGLVPNNTQQCGNINPFWRSSVYTTVYWIKLACPGCYTFPYDDPSSTFACSIVSDSTPHNSFNYDITFCPGNSQIPFFGEELQL